MQIDQAGDRTARSADAPPAAAAQEMAPKTQRWVDGLRDIDRAAGRG